MASGAESGGRLLFQIAEGRSLPKRDERRVTVSDPWVTKDAGPQANMREERGGPVLSLRVAGRERLPDAFR